MIVTPSQVHKHTVRNQHEYKDYIVKYIVIDSSTLFLGYPVFWVCLAAVTFTTIITVKRNTLMIWLGLFNAHFICERLQNS